MKALCLDRGSGSGAAAACEIFKSERSESAKRLRGCVFPRGVSLGGDSQTGRS